MKTGTVKFFNNDKGFGFIIPDGSVGKDQDVFVHISGLDGETAQLNKGDKVQYMPFQGKKGIQAKEVKLV